MAQLGTIVQYLTQLLDPQRFHDVAFNGLQVDSGQAEVSTVAFAVDAGQSVIEQAIAERAQLLIVHHGILWGQLSPIAGTFGRKIRTLIAGKCSLYASHLPLDGNPQTGNNVGLAAHFELTDWSPFAEYEGQPIGVQALCAEGRPLSFFVEKARRLPGAREPLPLPFGVKDITRVGIVSGAGAFALKDAAQAGLELLITGEPRQEAYHLAKELALNVLFAGHYATETVGVLSLKAMLEKDLGISTVFVHEETGI